MNRDQIKKLEPLIIKLLQHALEAPDSTAFYFDGKKRSYGDIANDVISTAKYFDSLTLRERFIVLSLKNSPTLMVAFLAGNMCNLNVGVFNSLWPIGMTLKALDYLQPDCVVFDETIAVSGCLVTTIDELPKQQYSSGDICKWIENLTSEHDLEQAFYTGFTSGSSGIPKGFVRSGLSWCLSFEADKREFGFSNNDIFVCPGSFAHSLFLYAELRAIYEGAAVLSYSNFHPGRISDEMLRRSATVLFVVPTQLLALCESAANNGRTFDSLRLVLSAGAKLSSAIREFAQETFPRAEIVEFYGSSEHGYISVSRDSESPPQESVGRAFNGVQIAIKDYQGDTLSVGKIGQVFVKSPYRFIGYAGANESSHATLPEMEGYVGTGDTGYLDEKGFLFLSGRTDRMIISSGHNIYPESIETVLMSMPGIRNAAVLSRPDKHRGQRLYAVVEFEGASNVTRSELMAFAKQSLPAFAVPSFYYVCKEWPMTVSYKTDFQALSSQNFSRLTEITL